MRLCMDLFCQSNPLSAEVFAVVCERCDGKYFEMNSLIRLSVGYFFVVVIWVILRNPTMFIKSYGRRHRIFGAMMLSWIIFGYVNYIFLPRSVLPDFLFDLVLGLLGITTTLSAASDFKKAHSRTHNVASGTLEKEATVTYGEMIEHSFYQILNFTQIIFLHTVALNRELSLLSRLALVFLASSLWLIRSWFPVNKFSDNYTKGQDVWTLISILYRTKKYQYIFYKHFLLHGLSATVAVYNLSIPNEAYFRFYWLCLNTSYVMEFFLQTLVKKGYMAQNTMMNLQLVLMGMSSVAAVAVLGSCHIALASFSLLLNFVNRKREGVNIALVLLLGWGLSLITTDHYWYHIMI
jgi:hypothetical protein